MSNIAFTVTIEYSKAEFKIVGSKTRGCPAIRSGSPEDWTEGEKPYIEDYVITLLKDGGEREIDEELQDILMDIDEFVERLEDLVLR